jgi:hypothetical protein
MSNVKEITDKITKAMEGVTAGLWETVTERENPLRLHVVGQSNIVDGLDGVCEATRSNDRSFAEDVANMRYIAACSPDNISVLLSALTAALALVPGEPVGETGEMPGRNGGFTMAAFKASDVPVSTKLYTFPTPHPSVDRDALLEEARAAIKPFAKWAHRLAGDHSDETVVIAGPSHIWEVKITAGQFRALTAFLLKLEGSSHGKD